MSIFDIFNKDIEIINSKAQTLLSYKEHFIVEKAMSYSFFNGGKRIRPLLTLYWSNMINGNKDTAVYFGIAVEMIHTYSLIHDDLPCMDNDDFRRGKPSCHKQFGEDNALLAGDALLTDAFKVLSLTETNPDNISHAVYYLSSFAGVDGMVGGQVLDLSFEHTSPSIDDIKKMYSLKTCALLKAACVLGCLCSDNINKEYVKKAEQFAEYLGLAFQIQDDILDIIGDEKLLGKPVGSDEKNNKPTFVRLYGIEKSKKLVDSLYNQAEDIIKEFTNNDMILSLVEALKDRNY